LNFYSAETVRGKSDVSRRTSPHLRGRQANSYLDCGVWRRVAGTQTRVAQIVDPFGRIDVVLRLSSMGHRLLEGLKYKTVNFHWNLHQESVGFRKFWRKINLGTSLYFHDGAP